MAVATPREHSYWASQWLPYGAAALVTIAATFSAWSLYLLPGFGYLALALTVGGTALSMYFRAAHVNRRLLNLGIVGISLVFIFNMVTRLELPGTGGSFVHAALYVEDRDAVAVVIQMFITVAMFRSFSLLTDRDLTLTIIPALSTILLASVVVSGVGVVVSMLLFFLGALYLLAFDHQETWAGRSQAGRLLGERRRRSLLAAASAALWLVLVPIVFAATIVFGWINLPRAIMMRYRNYLPSMIMSRVIQIAAPAWISPLESIRLGSGQSQRDNVLFRVESTEAALWRGATVDTYDHRGWTRSARRRHRERLVAQGDLWVVPSQDPGIRAGVPGLELSQTYHLSVPMFGVLVAAYDPKAVRGLRWAPHVSDSAVLTVPKPLASGTVYQVISLRKTAPGAAVYRKGVFLSPEEQERYRQLPAMPARTRRLAFRITARERDAVHKALALRAYLESKYVYRETVTPPPNREGVDFVDYFLFHMDGAYCDYFSSALAVMARINRIPSRVVTGFRSDEEDPQTGWWLIREKHAHSWVEVFIDGYGWLELDPSPQLGSRPSLIEKAQKGLSSALQAVKRAALAPIRALVAMPGWWWKLPAFLCAVAFVFLGVRYLLRDRPPPLPQRADAEQLRQYVRRCYQRMCRWLREWGLPKSPGATASEYATVLSRALGPQAEPMREVIRAYLAAEYSGRAPGMADARSMAQRLNDMLAARKILLRRAGETDQDE
jgi:transglutaminase-like putative cysteine protease